MSGLLSRLACVFAALVLPLATAGSVHAAAPVEVDAAEVASLLTPPPPATDVRSATRSPSGEHIAFLLEEYHADRYGDYVYEWQCRDNWVMRVDGSQLTRLTTSCDKRLPYSDGQSAAWWLPDGSLVSCYSSPVDHSGASTTRWVLAFTQPTDAWHSSGFRGSPVETTLDGRYAAVKQTEWSYSNTYWWALDLKTGKTHLMWDEEHQGDGHWTEACASAARPKDRVLWTPAADDVIAALSGDEPACTFARHPNEPKTPAPVPVDTVLPSEVVAEPLAPAATAPPLSAASVPLQTAVAPLVAITGATARRALATHRGFRVTLTTSQAGSLKVWLLAPDGDGGLSAIARKSVTQVNGPTVVNLPLNAVAKRQVRRIGRVTVRVAFTAPDGRRVAVERAVRLRR